jgi:hypothetical protein
MMQKDKKASFRTILWLKFGYKIDLNSDQLMIKFLPHTYVLTIDVPTVN